MKSFPDTGLKGASPAALEWLSGNWLGRNGRDPVEEHWSAARANTLVGMFRWVKDDKVLFYELMAIEQDADLVFLRIKHFDPRLVGWEPRERGHELVLVDHRNEQAVFHELDRPNPRWAVYRREAPDRLVSYFATADGAVTETGMFVYGRE